MLRNRASNESAFSRAAFSKRMHKFLLPAPITLSTKPGIGQKLKIANNDPRKDNKKGKKREKINWIMLW